MEILRSVAILLLTILVIAIGSKVTYQDNFAICRGYLALESGVAETIVTYPEGFNKSNCLVLSFMARKANNEEADGFCYGYLETVSGYMLGALGHSVKLADDSINIKVNNPTDGSHTSGSGGYDYKIVLMKIPEYQQGIDYTLGDVNGDGVINENDYNKMQSFLLGETSLTEQEFKAADIDKSGDIDSMDMYKLINYINNGTPLE